MQKAGWKCTEIMDTMARYMSQGSIIEEDPLVQVEEKSSDWIMASRYHVLRICLVS